MDLLREGAKGLGLSLGPQHLAAFELYYRELEAWNQRFNLTAVTGYEEVQRRHLLDSLTCMLALPPEDGSRAVPGTVPLQRRSRPLWIIDVGTGAGFPGLPLKVMLPEAKLTLIEATGKKVTFLKHVVELLELPDVEIINARAEEVGVMPEHRERYDFVVARAVAEMRVLAEYCLPFCRIGGRMVAHKGVDAVEETEAARHAFEVLGGELIEVKPITLPELRPGNHLVVVDKVHRTPDSYPRRTGLPPKRPL